MAKRKLDGVDGVALPASTKRGKQDAGKPARQTSNSVKPVPIKSNGDAPKKENGTVQKKKPVVEDAVLESAVVQLGEDVDSATIQIITGSYERTLHGFTAVISRTIPEPRDAPELKDTSNEATEDDSTSKLNGKSKVADATNGTSSAITKKDPPSKDSKATLSFTDTFLFTAHTSSIRCLAVSPLKSASTPGSNTSQSVLLATGSADERINLYNLSTVPPNPSSIPKLPTLAGTSISENPRNRELGALLHHLSAVTCLAFPTRAKLLSAAGDNTIAITRTRDWTPLSTIRAPVPKAVGRPSGDTAAPGEVPAGVNDIAVHPSLKLMLSVGKGEKCMRLWNLVTGKKAGVLNFSRDLLAAAGEGRWDTGEGRKVEWDPAGEEYVVGFERGVVVFGMDSKPSALILPTPRTKLHQLHYLPSTASTTPILALSTEDGRILFYPTAAPTTSPSSSPAPDTSLPNKGPALDLPSLSPIATLGGALAGIAGRIRDFTILAPFINGPLFVVTGSSDGAVRIWGIQAGELEHSTDAKQVGTLLGTYETGARITCLTSFVMSGTAEEKGEEEQAVVGADALESSDSGEESKSD
ncbi:WD40 repeat-like protein [Mytilinidion resinicola]|uniref:WD40 repeat-like protein n=1 Tax=Mytilinidion resinicola TaxID=574789 RepID=A0A6A6YM12_9PEZI|nr:WD40 repeat-like protein [Mytilinidion resinicola]KAF2809916.1 WD40 repeat-like protein [Mytilinidion resinicola]